MKINPIIPIWLMIILSVGMLCIRRKKLSAYIRQIVAVLLIFLINLRIMVPGGDVETKEQKLNVYALFVIDNTVSMVAEDYNGNTERLVGVKKDCAYIIDKLNGAKFAVETFNNNANVILPYTDNADFTLSVINTITVIDALYAHGSSMNISYEKMEQTLKRAKDKGDGYVAVFYISDGEITNDDRLRSFSKLKEYVDGGAVLGYGSSAGGKMYKIDPIDGQREPVIDMSNYPFEEAVSKIDEGNLKKIAEDLGIEYVNMNSGGNIDNVLSDIIEGREAEGDVATIKGYVDIYYIFAGLFVALMMYEFYVASKVIRGNRIGKRRDEK